MTHYLTKCSGRAPSTASRLGTKKTGVSAIVASWVGSCRITIIWNEKKQEDVLLVELQPWHGSGVNHVIYEGSINEFKPG